MGAFIVKSLNSSFLGEIAWKQPRPKIRIYGLDGLRNIKSQICSVKSEEIIKV